MRPIGELLFPVALGLVVALPSSPWGWLLPLGYFVVLFLGQGAIVLIAYRMPGLEAGSAPAPPATSPKVSVIVPARNEREDLARCLDDLGRQDWAAQGGAMEVLVVDGGSTDGTSDVARAHPTRPIVIEEPPLPEGWVGKNWGCHQGYLRATGDLLLFLDADVRLAPEAVRYAASQQAATGADLVTFASRIVMEGFWERVVMPLYVQFVLLYFVAPRVNLDTSSRAMANGQFLCFSRSGYERSGRHEGVRGAVLEDVRLAQEVKRRGGKVRLYWTPELVQTRMYSDRLEMDEGILKNLHGTRFSAARQVGLAAAIFVYFLSPFLVLALAAVGLLSFLWLVVALLLIGITLLKQVGFQRALKAPLSYGLAYPLGCAYYVVLFARSLRQGLRHGRVAWKGRVYDIRSGEN